MKKRTIILITMVGIVFVLAGGIFWSFFRGLTRYASPVESLNNCIHKQITVIDVLYEDDLAVVYYQEGKGTYSTSLVLKDERGWLPPEGSLFNLQKMIQVNDGSVIVRNISGRYVVTCQLLYDFGETVPEITHSSIKSLQQKTYTKQSGKNVRHMAVCSFDGSLPENYRIWIGDEEVVLSE